MLLNHVKLFSFVVGVLKLELILLLIRQVDIILFLDFSFLQAQVICVLVAHSDGLGDFPGGESLCFPELVDLSDDFVLVFVIG